jgi:hypothetical protein
MDFGKAFSFVFDDEDWVKKVLVGGLLILIPIIGGLVVLGWAVEITKRVIKGDTEVLPDWSDFGGYLTKGFLVFVIAFVFMLPVTLVSSCNAAVPFLFENADETLAWVFTAISVCFGCFTFLYSVLAYLILPAAIGRYAVTDKVGEAFKLGAIFKMVRDNLGTYALVLLGGLVASLVASLGVIACVIGVLFTAVYSMAINGHLWGQAYKESVKSAAPPADPAEPLPAAS